MVIDKGVGQTIGARGVLAYVTDPLLVDCFRPGLNIAGSQISCDIAVIAAGAGSIPDAGQIGPGKRGSSIACQS